MTNEITAPHKNFEGIKRVDENGIEFWHARELLPLLGYEKGRTLKRLSEEPHGLVSIAGRMWITILLSSVKWSKLIRKRFVGIYK